MRLVHIFFAVPGMLAKMVCHRHGFPTRFVLSTAQEVSGAVYVVPSDDVDDVSSELQSRCIHMLVESVLAMIVAYLSIESSPKPASSCL